jgi:Cu(I)/Ag(I) efflux system periplasmic protein CusF
MHRIFALTATTLVATAALAQAPTVAGEVVKIDKPAARVTLKHGGIQHLDMPAMSVSFRVRDPKMLDELVVGERIRFVADRIDGQYTVTMISKAPT